MSGPSLKAFNLDSYTLGDDEEVMMNTVKHVLDFGSLAAPFIVLFVVLLIAAFWMIFCKYRKRTHMQLSKLETQLGVLTTGSVGMGKKILMLEACLTNLQESQSQLQHSNVDFSFTQAQRLMTEGLANDAIAANSGLSSSEISLMRLLHSQASAQVENA